MENNQKPVIIHLVNSNIFSGLEKVAIDIIENLKDKYEFYYACKDGPIVEILDRKNIKRIRIEKISKREVLKIEKEYHPAIIHAHDYKATLFCGLYIKNTNVISHLHNNSPWIKKIFHPYIYCFLIACKSNKIKQILLVSEAIKKEYVFSKQISNKMKVIGNPLSRDKIISKLNENNEIIYDVCFSGRLTQQKNPIKFINIISKIKKVFPNIKVLMLGNGELKEQCKTEISRLGLENNINMMGFIDNPYKEMAKSKIFVLTSEWEGFGLVAFEAITLGLPCVVSKVGGLQEIIDDKCGYLCINEQDFVNGIINLLKNDNYKNYIQNVIEKSKKIENFNEYIKNIDNDYKKYIL